MYVSLASSLLVRNGEDGVDGKGWTGGSYSVLTGVVTFTSNDGLGFQTGDLRATNTNITALVSQSPGSNMVWNVSTSQHTYVSVFVYI